MDGGDALASLLPLATVNAPIVTTTPAPSVTATTLARILIVIFLREFIAVSASFVITAPNRARDWVLRAIDDVLPISRGRKG